MRRTAIRFYVRELPFDPVRCSFLSFPDDIISADDIGPDLPHFLQAGGKFLRRVEDRNKPLPFQFFLDPRRLHGLHDLGAHALDDSRRRARWRDDAERGVAPAGDEGTTSRTLRKGQACCGNSCAAAAQASDGSPNAAERNESNRVGVTVMVFSRSYRCALTFTLCEAGLRV